MQHFPHSSPCCLPYRVGCAMSAAHLDGCSCEGCVRYSHGQTKGKAEEQQHVKPALLQPTSLQSRKEPRAPDPKQLCSKHRPSGTMAAPTPLPVLAPNCIRSPSRGAQKAQVPALLTLLPLPRQNYQNGSSKCKKKQNHRDARDEDVHHYVQPARGKSFCGQGASREAGRRSLACKEQQTPF